jgi:predicted kinase
MTKPTCIVMVGLPATGKSTRVAALVTMNPNVFVYSTDKFIEDAAAHFGTTYDKAFEDNIKGATESMNVLLDEAIKHRSDIVWDQTNLGAKKRAKIINRMRQAGYRVECECIVPPNNDYDGSKEDWAQRLVSRQGKTIPPKIMESMMDSYVKPTTDEGFDAVHYYDIYGNLL